jgi:uncharacterized protein YjeT (DUF2065 family)
MELSIYLAQLLGVVFVVVGLGLLLRTSYYHKMYKNYVKNEALMVYGGLAALVLGLVIVLSHNVWVASWEVIITIFGWLAVVEGVLLLLLPAEMSKLVSKWFKGKGLIVFGGIFYLILGIVLGYAGWFA